MAQPKRLFKSEDNKVVAGVIGGLGEYFNVDPVILRVLWVLVVIFTGVVPGIIAYIFAMIIVPKRPIHVQHGEHHSHSS